MYCLEREIIYDKIIAERARRSGGNPFYSKPQTPFGQWAYTRLNKESKSRITHSYVVISNITTKRDCSVSVCYERLGNKSGNT